MRLSLSHSSETFHNSDDVHDNCWSCRNAWTVEASRNVRNCNQLRESKRRRWSYRRREGVATHHLAVSNPLCRHFRPIVATFFEPHRSGEEYKFVWCDIDHDTKCVLQRTVFGHQVLFTLFQLWQSARPSGRTVGHAFVPQHMHG